MDSCPFQLSVFVFTPAEMGVTEYRPHFWRGGVTGRHSSVLVDRTVVLIGWQWLQMAAGSWSAENGKFLACDRQMEVRSCVYSALKGSVPKLVRWKKVCRDFMEYFADSRLDHLHLVLEMGNLGCLLLFFFCRIRPSCGIANTTFGHSGCFVSYMMNISCETPEKKNNLRLGKTQEERAMLNRGARFCWNLPLSMQMKVCVCTLMCGWGFPLQDGCGGRWFWNMHGIRIASGKW